MGTRATRPRKADEEPDEDEVKVNRLTGGVTHKVDIVDRAANKRRFLVLKRDGTKATKQGDLAPSDSASDEDLRDLRDKRSKHYGIESLASGALRFPKDYPTNLDEYADPVNLGYPIDTEARAANARVRFKQNHGEYSKDESKAVVHERIIRAELQLGIEPSFDPDDDLDAMLPADLKENLSKMTEPTTKSDPMTEGERKALLDRVSNLQWGLSSIEWALEDCAEEAGADVPQPIHDAMVRLVAELETKLPGSEPAPEPAPSPAPVAAGEDEAAKTAKSISIPWEGREGWKVDPEKKKELQATIRMVRAKLMHAEATVMESPELPSDPAPADVLGMVSEAREILEGATMSKSEKAMSATEQAAKVLETLMGSLKAGEPVTEEQVNALGEAHKLLTEEPAAAPEPAPAANADETDKAEPTNKAGKPQLSKSRAAKFRAAMSELAKLLAEMDPELSKEDLWPERKDAEPEPTTKSDDTQADAPTVETLKAEVEELKKRNTELRAAVEKGHPAPTPSNLAQEEGTPPPAKKRPPRPLDLNDPEYLQAD